MRQRYVVEVVKEPTPTAHQGAQSEPVTSAGTTTTSPQSVVFSPPIRKGRRVAIEAIEDSVVEEPAPPAPDKVTARHEPPQPPVVEQKALPSSDRPLRRNAAPASSTQPPIDLLADTERLSRVEALLRDTQLADAREVPAVQKPAITKRAKQEQRKQMQQELSQRELAFQKRVSSAVESGSIEQYYRQHRQQRPSGGSSSAPRKQGRTWTSWLKKPAGTSQALSKRSKLLAGVGVAVMVVAVSSMAAYWKVRTDVLSTRDTAQEFWQDLHEGNIQDAQDRLLILKAKRSEYARWYQTLRPMVLLTQGESKTNHLDRLLRLSEVGIQVADTGLNAYDQLETGYQQFLGKEPGDSIATLQEVSGRLEALYTELSALQAELVQLDNPYHIEVLSQAQREIPRQLPVLRHTVMAGQQMSQSLPVLLGQDGKRQYLVLLQNNAELRPTGGFIGSFALITVENGKFVDLRVQDVYEADGQLNGFVTPPSEIVEYLGEEQWFMRDVNWSPDFPTVATQAEWFLDKSMNINPDGVIAINLHVAQKLLEATGPVKLIDYDEVVTATNLYERAEMYSEINFFPGSSQKRDFLSGVINQVMNQMMDGKVDTLKALQALYSSAQESQLLVALDDPTAQQAFDNLGWSGSVLTPDCPAPFHAGRCYVDTVIQVEANVGVNKANQHVERSIEHGVEILDQQAVHTRTTTLVNTATSNAWPSGPYKAYFRLYMPANAQVESVAVNGTEIDASLRREGEELSKHMIGFLVNVPVRESAEVTVRYTVPLPEDITAYALFEQKQSGTAGDPVRHRVTVNNRGVKTVAPEPFAIEGRTLEFVSERMAHDFMAVELE